MSMHIGGDNKGPMVDMNVTPLIDVLLVLIITFMVVTNLTPKGLDAIAPQSRQNEKQSQEVDTHTIVVSVEPGNHVKINETPVDINALGSQLDDIFKTRNERIIFIKGDSTLQFGDVARVIDIAKGVNIDKIGLITHNLEEGN
ncbi:MAG TPA: biopolymer transporter ExbD [Terriglobia bacterium]|nr:biopolymer transporter ExbD [Terriglobia bacterium]